MLGMMGCTLPPERELIPAQLLEGSVLTQMCTLEDARLRQAWWNAEQTSACQRVDAAFSAPNAWTPAAALWEGSAASELPPWRSAYLYTIAAQEVCLLLCARVHRLRGEWSM